MCNVSYYEGERKPTNHWTFREREIGAVYVITKCRGYGNKGGTVNYYRRRVQFDLKTENLSNKIQKRFGNPDVESKNKF